MEVEFDEEIAAKIKAVDAARFAKAEERNAAFKEGYKKAMEKVGYDRTRLIVQTMPEVFGGGTIHKVPTPETWAMCNKHIASALISDGKKGNQSTAVAGLVEHHALLEHPSISEMQSWKAELPGLYDRIHDAMESRCSHGQVTGK